MGDHCISGHAGCLHLGCPSVQWGLESSEDPAGAEIQCWKWQVWSCLCSGGWSGVREESGGNNERIGQYSYVDDKGKTITVKYSAGVNGFRILEGDHIPSGGQNSAAALTDLQGEPKEYDYEYYDDRKSDSVFVNPHDVSHQQEHLLAGNLAGHLAGRVFTTPPPGLTPAPRRQFPPGKIQLDRFPEGFNFNFNSQ